jgi:hypothetical protein
MTAQNDGRQFEKDFGSVLGVEPQKGSGNQWFCKMDVADGTILWSLKYTSHESLRITPAMIREVQDAITGQGGVGGKTIPGVATKVSGQVLVTLTAEDFVRLATSDAFEYLQPTKGESKRQRAGVPALLRDVDAEGDA